MANYSYRQNRYSRRGGYRRGAPRYETSYAKKRFSVKKKSGPVKTGLTKDLVRNLIKLELRGKAQIIGLQSYPSKLFVYNTANMALCNYFRVPVSQAIPGEREAQAGPDSRWRSGSKVLIKGVTLRTRLHYSTNVEIMAALYPAKVQTEPLTIKGNPATTFYCGMEYKGSENGVRLLTLGEANMITEGNEGPFEVVAATDNTFRMNAPDGSLFGCRLSKSGGMPVGEASWRVDKESKDKPKSGRTYYQQFRPGNDCPNATWRDSRDIQVYFKYEKEVEFTRSSVDHSNYLVFQPHLELIVGVRAMAVNPTAVIVPPVGMLESVTVDVHYT
jgi:hypothetical protein